MNQFVTFEREPSVVDMARFFVFQKPSPFKAQNITFDDYRGIEKFITPIEPPKPAKNFDILKEMFAFTPSFADVRDRLKCVFVKFDEEGGARLFATDGRRLMVRNGIPANLLEAIREGATRWMLGSMDMAGHKKAKVAEVKLRDVAVVKADAIVKAMSNEAGVDVNEYIKKKCFLWNGAYYTFEDSTAPDFGCVTDGQWFDDENGMALWMHSATVYAVRNLFAKEAGNAHGAGYVGYDRPRTINVRHGVDFNTTVPFVFNVHYLADAFAMFQRAGEGVYKVGNHAAPTGAAGCGRFSTPNYDYYLMPVREDSPSGRADCVRIDHCNHQGAYCLKDWEQVAYGGKKMVFNYANGDTPSHCDFPLSNYEYPDRLYSEALQEAAIVVALADNNGMTADDLAGEIVGDSFVRKVSPYDVVEELGILQKGEVNFYIEKRLQKEKKSQVDEWLKAAQKWRDEEKCKEKWEEKWAANAPEAVEAEVAKPAEVQEPKPEVPPKAEEKKPDWTAVLARKIVERAGVSDDWAKSHLVVTTIPSPKPEVQKAEAEAAPQKPTEGKRHYTYTKPRAFGEWQVKGELAMNAKGQVTVDGCRVGVQGNPDVQFRDGMELPSTMDEALAAKYWGKVKAYLDKNPAENEAVFLDGYRMISERDPALLAAAVDYRVNQPLRWLFATVTGLSLTFIRAYDEKVIRLWLGENAEGVELEKRKPGRKPKAEVENNNKGENANAGMGVRGDGGPRGVHGDAVVAAAVAD